MVTPKRTTTTSSAMSSQTSYYLLLAVKILFVLLILFLLPQFVTADSARHRRKRTELKLRNVRWACQNENTECSLLIPQESLNCVNTCISPACYGQVYAIEPLEDGEVDFVRAKAFESCVSDELRVLKHRLQREKVERESDT